METKNKKEICYDSFEEHEPGEAVPIVVEVKVPNEYGSHYLHRKRYRTPNEIYSDLHRNMNLNVCECGHEWQCQTSNFSKPCEKCGKGFDHRIQLIDEYDTCCHFDDAENVEIASKDYEINKIAVYCEVGNNEGYSVYVTIHLSNWNWTSRENKSIDVYRIKSFAGMEHCHMLVKRIMKLMGVWPNYGKDKE